jgi:recombination protein RecA
VKRPVPSDLSKVPGVQRGVGTGRLGMGRSGAGHSGMGHSGMGDLGPARWRHAEVVGRLIELSSHTGRTLIDPAGCATSVLTLALALVRDAQRLGETTVWVGVDANLFFPPDAARMGVDLAALPIVRAPRSTDIPRAAERLVRSGAFGLVVLDLTSAGNHVRIPPALLNRLAALAREHEAAVLCLTEKSDAAASLGPLVSLRATARRGTRSPDPTEKGSTGECLAILDVLRDRRRPKRWNDALPCHAPEGVETLLPRPSLS